MTHMRYWAMTLATAVCGAFIAIERFAFAPRTAVWIAFAVAIGATVFSLAAFTAALVRSNHVFSGLSAASVLIAVFTVTAMLVFSTPSATWLAFAAGVALLALGVRGLALHETTVERVVHALEHGVPLEASTAEALMSIPTLTPAMRNGGPTRAPFTISPPMRSWVYWLTHTVIALAAGLVVAVTFAFSAPSSAASPRWLAFGIAIATASAALAALTERALASDAPGPSEGGLRGRMAEMLVTGVSALASVALIATMASDGSGARWVAFALGCGLAGISLLAALIQ